MICSEHKFVIIRRVDLLMDLQRNMDLLEKLAILSARLNMTWPAPPAGSTGRGREQEWGMPSPLASATPFLQMEGAFPY